MPSDATGPDPARPQQDDDWDKLARNETPTQRLDRNWSDLLQELRVVQTGVQFLTGFLLTLPFQQRFSQLSQREQLIYLATVSASIAATAFLQAPVSVHRALFRRHHRGRAVLLAHRVAMVRICFLALAIVGVAVVIFDVVAGTRVATGAGVGVALLLGVLWLTVPLALRRGSGPS
jgi:hypothetical protein